jgi:hypothetical protein
VIVLWRLGAANSFAVARDDQTATMTHFSSLLSQSVLESIRASHQTSPKPTHHGLLQDRTSSCCPERDSDPLRTDMDCSAVAPTSTHATLEWQSAAPILACEQIVRRTNKFLTDASSSSQMPGQDLLPLFSLLLIWLLMLLIRIPFLYFPQFLHHFLARVSMTSLLPSLLSQTQIQLQFLHTLLDHSNPFRNGLENF